MLGHARCQRHAHGSACVLSRVAIELAAGCNPVAVQSRSPGNKLGAPHGPTQLQCLAVRLLISQTHTISFSALQSAACLGQCAHCWPHTTQRIVPHQGRTKVDVLLLQKIRKRRYFTGSIPGVLEAFLALRGFRSLPVRMQRHQENAMEIAKRLQVHPAVEKVLYPGTTVLLIPCQMPLSAVSTDFLPVDGSCMAGI